MEVRAPAVPGGCRVSVRRLTLTGFRCFPLARLEIGPGSVVLTGPNGAGKTSILEALSFLAPGRGLRRARLDEVGRRSVDEETSGGWAVAARLDTPSGRIDIGTGRDGGATPGERRQVRIDGAAARSQTALAEVVAVSWLTPEMERLFVEGATGRRRFLDRLVFGLDPSHAERISAYERAMRERARLLRDGDADPLWLSALEEVMATQGVAVAASRRDTVDRLMASRRPWSGPFPAADLGIEGEVEGWLDQSPALDCEDRLRTALAACRRIDGESGTTRVGPHRTDLVVCHGRTGRPAVSCSTGEQKTLLIAIVLAGVRMQAQERRALPLILLDEVAAHLDCRHRAALFDVVGALGAQAWYTGTDAEMFRPLMGRAQMLTVDDGTITGQGNGNTDGRG